MKALNFYEIIKQPLVTEKNTILQTQGKYVFEVGIRATKPQIKRAVETIYTVGVTDVNIISVAGKKKRVKVGFAMTPSWKKAVVSLKPGDKIELFEGV
jgi:large subunit ribosomal protein L23